MRSWTHLETNRKKMIVSPLTNKPAVLLREIPTEELARSYRNQFGIDTSNLFELHKSLAIYECPDTGYRFFYPYDIAGDGKFYEQLQRYDWYYMPWKWEHEQALEYIKPSMKILEVGCAKGSFLKRAMEEYKVDATGLELNKKAAQEAVDLGINVLTESIQEHASYFINEYDVICSFQVLEHIADIHSFIEAQVSALRPGGILIISVPNNAGFLGSDDGNLLNYPPHHMGLWSSNSLEKICDIYGLDFTCHHYEPMQDYHKSYFKRMALGILPLSEVSLISKMYKTILSYKLVESMFLSIFSERFKAFTIQSIYTKKA